MMFQKSFGEAGGLCYGVVVPSNGNKAGMGLPCDSVRKSVPARRKRNVLNGGMFNHNSRLYHRF